MKLVSFVQAGEERLGFLRGEEIVDPLRMSGDPVVFGSALCLHQGRRARPSKPRRAWSPIR